MTDPNEHQKALREALKYMGQVDKMMSIAVESVKKCYKDCNKFSDGILNTPTYYQFVGKRDLTEQMAKAIDWPLKGEWWKE